MQILEHGQAHPQAPLFFPCTAEPIWAFEDTVKLLSQRWHIFQFASYNGISRRYSSMCFPR